MTATFAAETNTINNAGQRAAFSSSLNRIVAIGSHAVGPGHGIATSDDYGTTWVGRSTTNATGDVAWGEVPGRFVVATGTQVATSSDGITWSFASLTSFSPKCVAWNGSLFVLGGTGANSIWTSADGLSWTSHANPGSMNADMIAVAWSPTVARWAITDTDGNIATSTDGSLWVYRATPLNFTSNTIRWLPQAAKFFVGGQNGAGTRTWAYSTTGLSWTVSTVNPFGAATYIYDVCELNSIWYVTGTNGSGSQKIRQSDDQGVSWTTSITAMDGETSAHNPTGLLVVPPTSRILVMAFSSIATIMLGGEAVVPTLPRFYEGYAWRWIVTDLAGATVTFLDPLAMNRAVTYTLNDAAIATCDLPSDNPEVNILAQGIPFVSNADKLLFAFRRENLDPVTKWVCRFAGVIESLNDEIVSGGDAPVTHLTAYDPWHYLDSRPVIDNASLKLPGQGGVTYPANGVWTPATIVRDLLLQTIAYSVAEGAAMPPFAVRCYIDFQTGHVPPTVDDTAPILQNINFQQGMTVGDAWRQLVADGLCDIILTPKYPPVSNLSTPGAGGIVQLNVYALAGTARNAAVFAWDRATNGVTGLNRLQDASTMGNHVVLYAGASGVPISAPPNAPSTQRFGPYWYQDAITGKQAYLGTVAVTAIGQVLQRAYGQPTLALDPAPERSPIPLLEYGLGDSVPIWASTRFREQIRPVLNQAGTGWDGLARVWSIPILIPDDAPETVSQMIVQMFPVLAPLAPAAMTNVVAPTWTATRAARALPMSNLKPPFTG